jgi:hypothetical protein
MEPVDRRWCKISIFTTGRWLMRTRLFQFLWPLVTLLAAACGSPIAASDPDPTTVLPTAAALSTLTPFPQFPPDSCPITQPPDPAYVPPEPHPTEAPYGDFWYGADTLWTLLRPDGRWHSLPQDEHGYGQKVLWFREGYDMTTEQQPALTVTGRRLDGDGATFETSDATNGYHADVGEFMLTGIAVPGAGCWEITGHYPKSSLSFVVWVSP